MKRSPNHEEYTSRDKPHIYLDSPVRKGSWWVVENIAFLGEYESFKIASKESFGY